MSSSKLSPRQERHSEAVEEFRFFSDTRAIFGASDSDLPVASVRIMAADGAQELAAKIHEAVKKVIRDAGGRLR